MKGVWKGELSIDGVCKIETTPLMQALYSGRLENANTLVSHGASLFCENNQGIKCLDFPLETPSTREVTDAGTGRKTTKSVVSLGAEVSEFAKEERSGSVRSGALLMRAAKRNKVEGTERLEPCSKPIFGPSSCSGRMNMMLVGSDANHARRVVDQVFEVI